MSMPNDNFFVLKSPGAFQVFVLIFNSSPARDQNSLTCLCWNRRRRAFFANETKFTRRFIRMAAQRRLRRASRLFVCVRPTYGSNPHDSCHEPTHAWLDFGAQSSQSLYHRAQNAASAVCILLFILISLHFVVCLPRLCFYRRHLCFYRHLILHDSESLECMICLLRYIKIHNLYGHSISLSLTIFQASSPAETVETVETDETDETAGTVEVIGAENGSAADNAPTLGTSPFQLTGVANGEAAQLFIEENGFALVPVEYLPLQVDLHQASLLVLLAKDSQLLCKIPLSGICSSLSGLRGLPFGEVDFEAVPIGSCVRCSLFCSFFCYWPLSCKSFHSFVGG
jgi:hypothetical protein